MHQLDKPMKAPQLRTSRWLNTSQPLSLADLQGQVVLIDFFDYTCLNCLHTLPYLKEWYRRYHPQGFTVIGVHTPEFEFAKEFRMVEQGLQPLDLPYPIALDSNAETWNAYGNRYWPTQYLLDGEGNVRAFHFGEGAYVEMEETIQVLLRERHPEATFPAPMAALHPLDDPTAMCYRPTPEIYLGYQRGQLGNRKGYQPGQVVHYELPETLIPDTPSLAGDWLNEAEYLEHRGDTPGRIALPYQAAEVNLVLYGAQGPATVYLEQDGHPLPQQAWGADVTLAPDGRPCVQVLDPRMVRLVKNPDYGGHRLVLITQDPGLRAYAFTFMSCVSSETALA